MAKGGSSGFDKERLGRCTANAQACLLEWGLVGDGAGRGGTGRDSRRGARSVGAEGGAAGTSRSRCWGLRRLPVPSHCQRLQRQVRAVEGSRGSGSGQLELRPRYSRGPGGRGGLDAARRTRHRGTAASGLGIWWAPQAWLPAEPLRNLLLIFSVLGPEVPLGRGCSRPWGGSPAAFSRLLVEGRCPASRRELGLQRGVWAGRTWHAWTCPWLLCREPGRWEERTPGPGGWRASGKIRAGDSFSGAERSSRVSFYLGFPRGSCRATFGELGSKRRKRMPFERQDFCYTIYRFHYYDVTLLKTCCATSPALYVCT